MRPDHRKVNQLRPVSYILDYIDYPQGSVLISQGRTRVLCNVSIEDGVPKWMLSQNNQGGWLTAEYSMLPGSTHSRTPREVDGFSGRTQEIRRLIGRSLRAGLNLDLLGHKTITIDCDVLQADGGTRTASITGGYVALTIALDKFISQGLLPRCVIKDAVAAVSVGVVNNEYLLDLSYQEDSTAQADMNVVMTAGGDLIEVQCTAEKTTIPRKEFNHLLDLASEGISELLTTQKKALKERN